MTSFAQNYTKEDYTKCLKDIFLHKLYSALNRLIVTKLSMWEWIVRKIKSAFAFINNYLRHHFLSCHQQAFNTKRNYCPLYRIAKERNVNKCAKNHDFASRRCFALVNLWLIPLRNIGIIIPHTIIKHLLVTHHKTICDYDNISSWKDLSMSSYLVDKIVIIDAACEIMNSNNNNSRMNGEDEKFHFALIRSFPECINNLPGTKIS
jgi:hypothetical protein